MARPKKVSTAGVAAHKKIHSIPGVFDIVPDASPMWEVALKRFANFGRSYGFSAVHVPIVEDPKLYELGSQSVIPDLSHHPIAFDFGGKAMAVRASMLPGVLRAYAAVHIVETQPLVKWAFSGQTVRADARDRPIADFEYGYEVLGTFNHLTEAQVLGAIWEMLMSLGLHEVTFEINNTGTYDAQQNYSQVLADFLKSKKYGLCDDCVGHLGNRILNVLRCNELDCQALLAEAPTILDFLDADSRKHFTSVLEALEELQIPYQLNPLYSGHEYTSSTSCVVKYKTKTTTHVLGEAAYHTMLAQTITGKSHQAFGFVGSMKHLVLAMESIGVEVQAAQKNEVYLVPLGELAAKRSLRLFRDLISAKISVYDHFGNIGVKSQLKAAQDSKSPIALIMGQKEAIDEMVILRDVKSGMQEMFHYDKILDEVKKRLGK